jgi:hypothetical protein
MHVKGRLGNFLSKGFTEVKEEDQKYFTKDGKQDMVFKTMAKKPVNGFHNEMVNWKKHDTVNVFHSEMVTVNVFYSEMVN